MHHSKPRRQLSTLCAFICYFHAFTDLFWAKWPWNWKAYKLTLKRLKLVMVSWSHPHSMCKKVERVNTKTGCTSCIKWTISFKVSGFRTKTHPLQRHFISLNLFKLHSFSVFKMHHSKPHHQFSTLSDFICYFSFTDFFSYMILKFKSTSNEL